MRKRESGGGGGMKIKVVEEEGGGVTFLDNGFTDGRLTAARASRDTNDQRFLSQYI